MTLIAAAAGLMLATSSELRQFDLRCDGETKTYAGPKAPEHWASRLSVDLDAGRWCTQAQNCSTLYRIEQITPDWITFSHRQTYYDAFNVIFARESKTFVWSYNYGTSVTYIMHGACSIEPFTSFPAASPLTNETSPQPIGPPG